MRYSDSLHFRPHRRAQQLLFHVRFTADIVGETTLVTAVKNFLSSSYPIPNSNHYRLDVFNGIPNLIFIQKARSAIMVEC